MATADPLPPLRQVVQSFNLVPKKALGQNFIFDLNLTGRIARAAGPLENVPVVEVGPGPGGLTRALLSQGAARVIAIERDPRCCAALFDVVRFYGDRLHVIEDDAMKVDLGTLFGDHAVPGTSGRICANLPYNVATALLIRWLQPPWPPWFDRLVLMFQREVAERIVATVADRKNYGRLAVLCGWRTEARILFDVAPSAFVPPPNVTSSIVELLPNSEPAPCNSDVFSAVTLAAFGQRRKMLRQSLKSLGAMLPLKLEPNDLLAFAGIDPTARAEEIDIAGFVALARACDLALCEQASPQRGAGLGSA